MVSKIQTIREHQNAMSLYSDQHKCVFGYRNVKSFGVNYTLFFSSTKQIGALLFSLAFLTVSSLVTNERVRKSALISAIGIAILFGSIEITTLQYRLYPPFGLVTEAFMTLGAYLLLVGLITSATSVARDAKVTKRVLQERYEPD